MTTNPHPQKSLAGKLPAPEMMEAYKQMDANFPARILAMAEAEQKQKHRLALTAQWLVAVVASLCAAPFVALVVNPILPPAFFWGSLAALLTILPIAVVGIVLIPALYAVLAHLRRD